MSDKRSKISKTDLQKLIKVYRFIWPYRWMFAIGCIFLILSSATAMSLPYFIGELVKTSELNQAEPAVFLENLKQLGFLMGGLLLAQAVFSFARIYCFSYVSEHGMRNLRQTLFDRLLGLSIPFYDKNKVGEVTSRLTNDVTQLQDTLSYTLAEFFRQVAIPLIGIPIVFFISAKLSFIMLATIPLVALLALVFGRLIRRVSKQAQGDLADANSIAEESLSGIRTIKAFTYETVIGNRYKHSMSQVLTQSLRSATYRGAFVSFVILAIFGVVLGIIWFGALQVGQGHLSVGSLIQFIIYTLFIGSSFGGLGDSYSKIQKTIGATSRIEELLDEPLEGEETSSQSTEPDLNWGASIEIQQLRFAYASNAEQGVLNGIDLTIPAGKTTAIVGKSGAGKTSLAHLLMRFYEPTEGSIALANQSIVNLSVDAWRQQVAIVSQDVMLFNGTLEDNIRLGNPLATTAELVEAARQANALEFIDKTMNGWQTEVGDRGLKLSGGQKQRIAIARAILKNPNLLILDEATSALDSVSEQLVQEALNTFMQGRTTLVIAHRLSTVKEANQLIVLDEGQIVEQGTHSSLAQIEGGVYRELLEHQLLQGA